MRGALAAALLASGLMLATAWLAREAAPPRTSAETPSPRQRSGLVDVAPVREPSGARTPGTAIASVDRVAAEEGPIQAVEISPGFYQVRVRGLRALLDDPRRALGTLGVGAFPAIGPFGEPGFEIVSDVADGLLARNGLLVTDPKGLRLAGVQVGDILRTVNGHPLSHLYLVLVQLRREPDATSVRLELERNGTRIIRGYEIRGL